MECRRRYFRQHNSIFIWLYPQLWYRYYFNDHSYQGNLISLNAKTDGFYARNAEDPAFNEGGTGEI